MYYKMSEIKLYTVEDYEYICFKSLMKEVSDGGMLNEFSIPSFLSKQYNFVKELASNISVSIKDIAKLFMNRTVFNFFSKIKWSFDYIFDLAKRGLKIYREVLDTIGEYIAKTKVGRWTDDKLKDLDNFLKTHPKIKRIAGIGVAALLIYIWFNMTFTGDFEYDFNLVDVVAALAGKFSLTQIFAGKDGMKLLLLFATGVIGLSFPWPGPTSVKFLTAVIQSVAKWAKMKIKTENHNPYTENLKNGYIIREFDTNIPTEELVWHRDKKNRIVEVISGNGWKFQMDNQLPIELKKGMQIQIPKETFHRIGKGNTKLVIKIKE
jgi:hypothetical protein